MLTSFVTSIVNVFENVYLIQFDMKVYFNCLYSSMSSSWLTVYIVYLHIRIWDKFNRQVRYFCVHTCLTEYCLKYTNSCGKKRKFILIHTCTLVSNMLKSSYNNCGLDINCWNVIIQNSVCTANRLFWQFDRCITTLRMTLFNISLGTCIISI